MSTLDLWMTAFMSGILCWCKCAAYVSLCIYMCVLQHYRSQQSGWIWCDSMGVWRSRSQHLTHINRCPHHRGWWLYDSWQGHWGTRHFLRSAKMVWMESGQFLSFKHKTTFLSSHIHLNIVSNSYDLLYCMKCKRDVLKTAQGDQGHQYSLLT